MIKYEIRGENIEVTGAIREHIEKKLDKLERYFANRPNTQAHVNIKTYNNSKAKIEVTIPFKDLTLRAEERHDDLYAATDLIVDKLERQIRKHKTKVNRKFREKGLEQDVFNHVEPTQPDHDEEDDIKIIKSKQFSLKPMDAEEAVLQMNMLGHDFYIFTDAETDETSIVYRRKDDKYGLIETK